MLTDEQWVVLWLLVERCRPHAKVPPSNLRRTMSTILWRHANGAKWRSISAELGPWWMAAQIFIRWARLGVWERLLLLAQERSVRTGMTFLDGTSVARITRRPAPGQKRRSGAPRRKRSAWPLSWRLWHQGLRDRGRRRASDRLWLAPGQAHELPQAVPLLDALPGVPRWVVADRGYSSHCFREHVWGMGARPAVAPKSDEAPWPALGGSTTTATASRTCGPGSRSGGRSPHATRRPPAHSWACSASPPPSTGSGANGP